MNFIYFLIIQNTILYIKLVIIIILKIIINTSENLLIQFINIKAENINPDTFETIYII